MSGSVFPSLADSRPDEQIRRSGIVALALINNYNVKTFFPPHASLKSEKSILALERASWALRSCNCGQSYLLLLLYILYPLRF